MAPVVESGSSRSLRRAPLREAPARAHRRTPPSSSSRSSGSPLSDAPDTDPEPISVLEDEDEAPATSRSEELIISGGRFVGAAGDRRRRASARDRLEQLIDDLGDLIRKIDANDDGEGRKVSPATRAALLKSLVSPLRLLGQLNGEIGASESQILASPIVQTLLADIVDALKPFPDAMRAVHAAISARGATKESAA